MGNGKNQQFITKFLITTLATNRQFICIIGVYTPSVGGRNKT